jgi:hypothetical protein
MHFFYIDESGDTGQDLLKVDQPILVLGGVSVKDTGWTRTQSELTALIDEYFHGVVPDMIGDLREQRRIGSSGWWSSATRSTPRRIQ